MLFLSEIKQHLSFYFLPATQERQITFVVIRLFTLGLYIHIIVLIE